MKELDRRHFLRWLGAGALALGSAPRVSGGSRRRVQQAAAPAVVTPRYPGRVVEVLGDGVFDRTTVRPEVVDRMLERGLLELTGAADRPSAWRLFVSPDDVVGIKVNTLTGPGCSTRREVVQAIVRGLRAAGVPDANIIVWDRFESHLHRANYVVTHRPGALRCYATDSPGVGSDMDVYYEANVLDWIPARLREQSPSARGYAASYNNSHFSTIFTQHITKQINVPVLKDHNITGVTLGLKNVAFGICSNTERFHPSPINCDPMIAQVCAHPMVQAKNVLTVADCLSVLYEGGPMFDPRYLFACGALILGTDMVATDTIGLQMLDGIRRDKGLPSLRTMKSSPPKYLDTAAKLELGVGNVEEIEHLKLTVQM
jgi:uncharacterized protein (DUF362 family)